MSFVRDALGFAGSGLVLYGLSQWSVPAACVAGGVLLVGFAAIWSLKASPK